MTAAAGVERAGLRRAAILAAGIAALLVAAWLAYRPGLSGPFLFDDFPNLPALGAYGPVDNVVAFWRYLTSGSADPTGRPLALLSFLIDARNWPADPYPFKRTSVLLHLGNGALLVLLLARLGRIHVGDPGRARLAALVGGALWLLHPLFVSTTLYVVQREAMLPATFTLLGLIGYVAGRERAAAGIASGAWIAAGSVLAATAFAVLCKANGVLVPLLVWIVDASVLERRLRLGDGAVARAFSRARLIAVSVPAALILLAIACAGLRYAIKGVPEFRPWTFAQRLISEPRVIADYLALLLIPRPYTTGLFNDAFQASTGLLSPWTTLPAIVLVAGLFALAIATRRRAPALTLAILFYLAGQLLESTVIPLELYYEHRNYLPALLLFWPIALWLTADGELRAIRRALCIVLPALLAALTWMRADLWGNAHDQALLWAARNPDSPRAQAYAAQTEMARGHADDAVARLERIRPPVGEDLQIALNLIGARCDLGALRAEDIDRAESAFRAARMTGQLGYDWLSNAISALGSDRQCRGLGVEAIRRLLDAAAQNPHARDAYGRRQDNLDLRGQLALALHDPARALAAFDAALDVKPRPAVALKQAAELGNAGYPRAALRHLDHFEAIRKDEPVRGFTMQALHARLLRAQHYWSNEITHLESALRADADAAPPEGSTP